ncbi:hypothetical protein HOLleu_11945 [Holothuria leucospilota]|uniref:Uncharacterized protein n=1 Tax=Holothuria leucospilota TaxID=206669 RepID=A0A9Q1HDE4_HOLLE|nr:hypothetical protein HOLleu_11945 [Holothuria leucospilota]
MAEAPAKFTPKKRPKSCMQSSDDGSDSTVEDLCRKKFKPIAPKPFLKKDSHQSVLTTVLPVKQPPSSDTKDTTLTSASTITSTSSSTTSNKYGDIPSMPVMYGGPVFIPVRFPFPVLVPAMFNINGNQQQKCTCYSQKETSNKASPSEGVEPSLSKAESVPQQPCPLHYSFNSNQPTYINHPIPNVQSSFMPVYMGSGGSMQNKSEWPGKPKYSRYKYSMLKNGDIYKGLASNIQSYQDIQVPVSSSQVPGQYLSFTSKANQYSNQNCLSKEKPESQPVSCAEAPCFSGSCSIPCSAPSKCDTMCQTASVQNSSAPQLGQMVQHESNTLVQAKSVGVDAAVQTDSQEVEAADNSTKRLPNTTDVRVTNSSSVQCSLSSGQRGFTDPTSTMSYHSPVTTTSTGGASVSAQVGTMGPVSSGSIIESGVPSSNQGSNSTAPSASSSAGLSTASFTAYPSPSRSMENIRQSGTMSSQSSVNSTIPSLNTVSDRSQQVTSDERTKSSFADTPTSRVPGSSFTSRSEVSTSSEALQQRNYETDVIVPLRAAPSPSDAHDVEDMDRFVLSPVISESDNEDMFSRNMPSASTFYRPLRHDRHLGGPVPGPSSSLPRHNLAAINPVRASSLPPSGIGSSRTMHLTDVPGPAHLSSHWVPPFSQPLQSHERQLHNNVYASSASSLSVGHGLLGTRSGVPIGNEHGSPHPGFHSITPYPPTTSVANSVFCPPNPFSKQPHGGLPQSTGRAISDLHQYPSSRMSTVQPMSSSSFSSEDQSPHSRTTAQFPSSRPSEPTRHGEHYSSLHRNRGAVPQTGVATSGGDKQGSQTAENSDQSRRVRDSSQVEKPDFENRPSSSGDAQGRLRDSQGSIQSVPLQSNIAGSRDGSVQRNMRKDVSSLPYTNRGTSSTERSFEAPSLGHGSNRANILGLSEDRNAGSLSQSHTVQEHHRHDLASSVGLHSNQTANRGVPSSSSGYPVSYVPPLVCRSSVPPMPVHDTPSHHVHGLPPRPMSGTGMSMHGSVTPGLSPAHSHTTHPHPFQPGGTYHGQHNHMFYPHYGSLHQPLSMSPSPAPSHSDLSLLSPRSCTHLHLHGNMLHSPQMPSSMHNFQRTPGFAGGLHAGSYPYSVMEDRLDTCCSGRLGHSPPSDDRSIPTLLTNILHRRPGAFSHLEQTASGERSKPSEGSAPSQASTATSTATPGTTTVSSVVASSVQTRPSPSSIQGHRNTLSTGSTSIVSPVPAAPLVQQKSVASTGTSSSTPRLISSSSVSSLPSRTVTTASASTSSRRVIPPSPTSAPSPQTRGGTHSQIPTPRSSQQNVPTASPSSVSAMSPMAPSPSQNRPATRSGTGNNSDKYLPVEAVPPSPAPSNASAPTPDSNRQNSDQVVKYGETILKCSRQILRESGRTVLCCWNCDYHTAEPRKMHRHQKKESQPQKCQLCDFRSDTRCTVNQHYKEVHMDKDDPFRSVSL